MTACTPNTGRGFAKPLLRRVYESGDVDIDVMFAPVGPEGPEGPVGGQPRQHQQARQVSQQPQQQSAGIT